MPTLPRLRSRRGLTLVEVMVATGLAGILLAGVFSSVFLATRSSARLQHLMGLTDDARVTLQQFSTDIWEASRVVSWDNGHILLEFPHPSELPANRKFKDRGRRVAYTYYDTGDSGYLRRQEFDWDEIAVAWVPRSNHRDLLSHLSEFAIYGYPQAQPGDEDPDKLIVPAPTAEQVRRIEFFAVSRRALLPHGQDVEGSTLSARFVLRNTRPNS
jgi:prepilin-type N-terminal cleavage/methylation domain-containing protein